MATDSAAFFKIDIDTVIHLDSASTDMNVTVIELDAAETFQNEEAAKQAALDAIDRMEKTPNEDKILADLDVELAAYRETHKNSRGGSLNPELLASIEEYIEELKEATAKRPPVKLQEDKRKYERNAGNDPNFVNIPTYDPTDPRFCNVAATIKRAMETAEQQKKEHQPQMAK